MLMPNVNSAIETCLDVGAMRAHLQAALATHGEIAAVRITKARRSASRHRDPNPLVLCYEIALRTGATLHCYGKLYRNGASALAGQGGRALHLPQLDVLLWPWPADPGLPQLEALMRPQATQPIWGETAQRVQALRYEPERRATLRYTRDDNAVLYAKTYGDARAPAVYRRFAWAWAAAQQTTDAPLVARPLEGGDAEHTVWQEAASGAPLLQLLNATNCTDWIGPLARAIAAIHAAPVALAGVSPRTMTHWLTEVGRRRKKIGRVLPELAGRADATASAIERAAAHVPDYAPTVIHGDFHPDQVWFDGQRIVLFDFDEFALGDPMEDLAEFIVKLPVGAAPSPSNARLAALWLGAYAQIAPHLFCQQRLAWHMAVQQLLQASRAFVFQVADWRGEVARRLERAEHLAHQCQGAQA